MATKDNLLVGQILIEQHIISPEQLDRGLQEQKKTGGFICSLLVKLGFANEETIFSALARHLNIPYIHLKSSEISSDVVQRVPAKFANHYKIIPISYADNCLVIAMADPLDIRIIDDIRLLLETEVKAVLASETEIQEAIRKYYGVGAETLEKMIAQKSPSDKPTSPLEGTQDLESLAEDASIITFVNQILSEAIKERATDVHLEPFNEELRVRFRIDGMLYDVSIPESIKYFTPAIVSRIKIMSRLNIAERRLPQDGRMKIKLNEQELDLRVSVIPTIFGESVQIRLLSSNFFLELEKIGMYPEGLRIIEKTITKPHGIIFVTGPTGSGKTTTLYACLAQINSPQIKIITTEDPVEYQLRGINQIQISPQIGLDFATVLKHILRHDPDVIMVGEVRDYETAEIAIRSALTGHLVFSTLHTNDAAGAITRLIDMKIEPFLVASSLECLIAQRLVRLICPHCKTKIHHPKEIDEYMQKNNLDPKDSIIYEGKGCKACRFTGYLGRTAIHEILLITDEIREMILNRSSSQQIKQKAISEGMRTLLNDGLQKVVQGITTYTEVMRVTRMQETSSHSHLTAHS
jgi:type II secretion system protein E